MAERLNGPFLMGIDIGTSSTKTLLCSSDGKIIAEASVSYPLHSPRPGWNEQDPKFWWEATVSTVREVIKKAEIDGESVSAIGLSGQMHGSVFLDSKNQVIRNALLWNDQRTQAECSEITKRAGGKSDLIRLVNNVALTGFTAPKILWLRANEPEHFALTKKVLLPKDYIRLLLTGEYASDVSDASGTLLLDVCKRKWSHELLDRLDLRADLLPALFESPEVTGTLSKKSADLLTLSPKTIVVGGAGDQPAGAVGMGVVEAGVVSATIGTSGVVFAHSERPAENPEGLLQSFCHAVPEKWCEFGCMLSAGGSFEWLRDTLKGDFDEMIHEAEFAPAGSDGLYFLPYLDGERCPYPDPYARGAWIGLSRIHGRSHLIRSVLEGVTFGMADQIEMMRSLGLSITEVRCGGGGAKSPFWRKLQADIFDAKTVMIDTENASSFGAALLAGVGAKIWNSVEEACRTTLSVQSEIEPDLNISTRYRKRHAVYRELYQKLKASFKTL